MQIWVPKEIQNDPRGHEYKYWNNNLSTQYGGKWHIFKREN